MTVTTGVFEPSQGLNQGKWQTAITLQQAAELNMRKFGDFILWNRITLHDYWFHSLILLALTFWCKYCNEILLWHSFEYILGFYKIVCEWYWYISDKGLVLDNPLKIWAKNDKKLKTGRQRDYNFHQGEWDKLQVTSLNCFHQKWEYAE